MKLKLIGALTIALIAEAPGIANAQSSVTIFGVLDTGIAYFSNQAGGSAVLMTPGIRAGDRVGFSGSEDLGGGYRTIFLLENGFNLPNGTLAQGGLEFGRQAWFGLATPAGKITLGRQYDYMYELRPYTTAGLISGLYGFHLGDYDRIWGERLNNTLAYQSAAWNGLRFGVMYSFGGQPGQFREGSGESANVTYKNANLSMGMSYTKIYNTTITPASSIGATQLYGTTNTGAIALAKDTNIGLGASYDLRRFTVHGAYTRTYLDNGAQEVTLQVLDGGVNYRPVPDVTIGTGYSYSKMNAAHWGTVMAGADYSLSKRTDVYSTANYIHATGQGAHAELNFATASSGRDQTEVLVGIRHRF